jgi:hypothetical protein
MQESDSNKRSPRAESAVKPAARATSEDINSASTVHFIE